MDVLSIYAYIKSLDPKSKNSLLNHGWDYIENRNDCLQKITEEFQFILIPHEFGDQIICSSKMDAGKIKRYHESTPFNLEQAWKSMWTKNIPLMEVHICFKEIIWNYLIDNNWEINQYCNSVLNLKDDTNFLYLIRNKESQSSIYSETQDAKPGNALEYLERLKSSNILK